MAEETVSTETKSTPGRKAAATKDAATKAVKDTAAKVKAAASEKVEEAEAAASTAYDNLRDKAGKAGDRVKQEAGNLKDSVAAQAKDAAEKGKAKAASAAAGLGKLVEDSAETIDRNLGERYGDYARSAAKSIENMAGQLDSKEVEELLEDARNYVKKSPGVAIGAAAVLGFVVARLLKSGGGNHGNDA